MWTLLLTVPLAGLALLLLLPTLSELVSFGRAWAWRAPVSREPDELPRFILLVLAHNEELLLATTIRSLAAQDYPAELLYIVVVADNCSDDTAGVARAEGVVTLERHDLTARGKPFAIAWALDQLSLPEYDGVVIIDADTEVAPSFLRCFAVRSPLRDKVLQPSIGVQNADETALTKMAAVHGTVAHGLAYRVKERAGLNVPLGVGMCIGTSVLLAESWRAFSIAEDWELYCIFTERGVRIEPVVDARIYAQEAKSLTQSAPQRHRWLAGKTGVLLKYLVPVIRSPMTSLAQSLDTIAELTAPGPAVHLGAAVLAAAVCWLVGGPLGALVTILLLVSLIRPVGYTIIAIAVDPKPVRALSAFLYLPIYTAWRIGPAIRSVFSARASRWVRTDRHSTGGGK